jgi:hypothetical protein
MDRITSPTCRSLRLYWQLLLANSPSQRRGRPTRTWTWTTTTTTWWTARPTRTMRSSMWPRVASSPPAPPRVVVRTRLLSHDDNPPLLLLPHREKISRRRGKRAMDEGYDDDAGGHRWGGREGAGRAAGPLRWRRLPSRTRSWWPTSGRSRIGMPKKVYPLTLKA